MTIFVRYPRIFFMLIGVSAVQAGLEDVAQADTQLVVAFDATISEIEGDVQSLDLPLSISRGVQIEGELAFGSREEAIRQLQGNTTIFSNLMLDIEDTILENLFNISLVNGGIGSLDGELYPGPIDLDNPPSSIYFSYLPVSMGTPGWVGSGLLPIPWTAEILMVDAPGIIDSPEGLLDFDDWNRLNHIRELTILFGFPDTVEVTATLGNFVVIPEPSSLAMLFIATGGLVLLRHRDSSRFSIIAKSLRHNSTY